MLKKQIIYIFVCFCFLYGCADGTYIAEKKLWHANYKLRQFLTDKDSINNNDERIDELIFSFKEIVMRYPFWERTPQAHFILAKLYKQKKNYSSALKECRKICENFTLRKEDCARALKNIIEIAQLQNDWQEAEKTYETLIKVYSDTSIGLPAMVYLAQEYKKRGELEKAKDIFSNAFEFYKQMISKENAPQISLKAVDLSVICILNLSGANAVTEFLLSLKDEYAGSDIEIQAVLNLAKNFQYNLKQKKEALKYYQYIVEKYPKMNIVPKIKDEIEKLND
ncbi:MAG: hypothetical protein DRP78_06745 [Candidatus Omnitrophota bacterium]|nr:MAG: hypothetical protein DRP78_06745 [Candidatus Omnitrophota bacterium]